MNKVTIQYKLIYKKRSRHSSPGKFSFRIQGRGLMQRRDIDRFVYHVAKWAAEAMKGDFRIIRFTSTPLFSIYDLKDEQKFHKHWTSFPQSGRQNVYVFTFN